MIKYTIKSKDLADINMSVVEKTNFPIHFKFEDIRLEVDRLTKAKVEIIAKAKVERAAMKNVLQGFPETEEMDEKKRIACQVYQGCYDYVKRAEEKLEEIDKAIKEYKDEVKEIIKQTKIEGINIWQMTKKN